MTGIRSFKLTFTLLALVSLDALSQEPNRLDHEKLKKHSALEVINSERINNYIGLTVKNYYAVTFSDSLVRIYNSSEDTLSKMSYSLCSWGHRTFLGKTANEWRIFREIAESKQHYWKPTTTFPGSQFDSIKVLWHDHFLGYQGDKELLFNVTNYYNDSLADHYRDSVYELDDYAYEDDTVSFYVENISPFVEISCSPSSVPVVYSWGVFVTLDSNDPSRHNKIAYLDLITGRPKSTLVCDSIFNYPTIFDEYSLVHTGNSYVVYSFQEDEFLETACDKHYLLPVYGTPFIVNKEYIGLTGAGSRIRNRANRWTRIKIKNVIGVEFVVFGDRVYAMTTTAEGEKHIIDAHTAKKLSLKEYKKIPWVFKAYKL